VRVAAVMAVARAVARAVVVRVAEKVVVVEMRAAAIVEVAGTVVAPVRPPEARAVRKVAVRAMAAMVEAAQAEGGVVSVATAAVVKAAVARAAAARAAAAREVVAKAVAVRVAVAKAVVARAVVAMVAAARAMQPLLLRIATGAAHHGLRLKLHLLAAAETVEAETVVGARVGVRRGTAVAVATVEVEEELCGCARSPLRATQARRIPVHAASAGHRPAVAVGWPGQRVTMT
jgi:hypothetical protein